MAAERKSVNDWTSLPFIVITSAGFIAAGLDFVVLQNLQFQVFTFIGLVSLAIWGYVRFKARLELKEKAKFESLAATGKLATMKNHQLVTDGLYQHIRHPIYLGETLRNLGIVTLLSSICGVLFIVVATSLLLFRIGIEEKLLIEVFSEDYKEYQQTTKKLIPHIY